MKIAKDTCRAIALVAALASASGCGLLKPKDETETVAEEVVNVSSAPVFDATAETLPTETPAAPTAQPSEAPTELPTPASPAAEVNLSDDLYSFELALNGVVYTLPAPFAQFAQNGWTGENLTSKSLNPSSMTLLDVVANGPQQIYISFCNNAMDVLPYDQCNVGSISLDRTQASAGAQLVLPKGISLGATYEAVVAAYGQPTDLFDSGTAKSLTYQSGTYSVVTIDIDSATNQVYQIKVENLIPKPNAKAQATAAPAASSETPASVGAYQAPAALGDNWNAFNVKYAGTLYHLPAPVAAFVANGWVVESNANDLVAGQSSTVGIVLRKENETLRTTVRNYADAAQPVANCFVTSVLYSVWDTKIPLELPKGITEASHIEDIIAAYGQPTSQDSSAGFDYYTYGDIWEKVDIVVEKETNAIIKLEVEHHPKTLTP